MSVQEMMKRFEKTGLSDVSPGSTPGSAPTSACRPRSQVARRTASYRTNAPPPRLRHRNSESRIGLTRSRPVSAHISPLLRERPAVLKRNAALKARVSDRMRDLERRPSAETVPEAEKGPEKDKVNGSPSPPLAAKAGQQNGGATGSGVVHSPLTRVIPTDNAAPRPLTGPAVNHAGSPTSSPGVNHTNSSAANHTGSADIDNNNKPVKPSRLSRQAASAVGLQPSADLSALPLPAGPPPAKPPRTFAHDVYVQARQSAGAATTVTIRRSSSGPRPSIARKPSNLGRRRSGRLETFQPRPAAGSPADPPAGSLAEHVYAEPAVSRRDLPPPPPSPPPPLPPSRIRRSSRAPVEPYAVSSPLRRTASDETLYGTLSRDHVYERLSPAKTRPFSISSGAAGSPPGLRRNTAFKRHERPSVRHAGPARPPPPSLARAQRQTDARIGCLLTADSGDSAGDQDDAERSERWKAGPMALRRRNYLRRVSISMGGSRPRLSVRPPERLFDALLVVALSADAEGRLEPCVVSRYPPDVSLVADVAPFCFPDAARWQRAPDVWGRSAADGGAAYTVVVTDEHGGRSFGFCRRLTADTGGDAVTLPIAYCLLTSHDAPAFYSKLLSALLDHHGTSEQHRLSVLDELHGQPFPLPGGSVSVPCVPACPGDQTEPLTNGTTPTDAQPVLVRRPLDSRLEEDGLFLLVRRLGVDLFIKLLGSALLERKIVLYSAHLGVLSTAVSALQAALCPFVWQHCLVPVVPSRLAELLAVPSPFIMGALPETRPLEHLNDQEDVICVDLDTPSLVQSVGDEATILPRRLSRTLSEALKLAACLPGGDPAPGVASVMLAETLLRLFVEVCGHYRSHLVTQQDGRPVRLQREAFVEAAPTDDVREFLEWFTETAMFNAFIESCDQQPESPAVSLFDRRVMEQHVDTSGHGLLWGTKQLGKALGGRFKFRLPS